MTNDEKESLYKLESDFLEDDSYYILSAQTTLNLHRVFTLTLSKTIENTIKNRLLLYMG